jgi:hypothetical protein
MEMKKTILSWIALACFTGVMLTSCNSPVKKVESAQKDVTAAKVALDKANAEFVEEVENYRRETESKIKSNNERLADFNTRVLNERREAKADYQKEIAKLEQRNKAMKLRLDSYTLDGEGNWEKFKIEFDRDMEELAKAFKDLSVKNVK